MTPPRELDPDYPRGARSDRDARAREGEGQALPDRARACRPSSRRWCAPIGLHVSPIALTALHGGDVRAEDRGVARGAGQGHVARRASREAAASENAHRRRRSRGDRRDAGARRGALAAERAAFRKRLEAEACVVGRARRRGVARRGDAGAARAGRGGAVAGVVSAGAAAAQQDAVAGDRDRGGGRVRRRGLVRGRRGRRRSRRRSKGRWW